MVEGWVLCGCAVDLFPTIWLASRLLTCCRDITMNGEQCAVYRIPQGVLPFPSSGKARRQQSILTFDKDSFERSSNCFVTSSTLHRSKHYTIHKRKRQAL